VIAKIIDILIGVDPREGPRSHDPSHVELKNIYFHQLIKYADSVLAKFYSKCPSPCKYVLDRAYVGVLHPNHLVYIFIESLQMCNRFAKTINMKKKLKYLINSHKSSSLRTIK